ncbi:hypothetical protein IMG5_119870 [Ichthyophthirius multifiliis]|uniref:Armadillo-type fold n=1 Tax=Ichthyophthirius multifiliis TaxID=5932 RepID=G0QUW7_ICHMU|nr:hypothetical protein IMG5_119870 [Ichthyophthirius multifiliis]EGR30972.1 hypothetical protein IMG5_119870 [Ichthyophthirius multifiliis]|eukprot:XP_004034458.1 hypothetical protein IMG5_119870 [Ichthyophthirius multifiliis]
MNPFGQVCLKTLKIYGRYTNYLSKINNNEIYEDSNKDNVDKLLIGLGIPIDMIGWFDQDARVYDHAPIDQETRVTLRDMVKIKDQAIIEEDFEGLKVLGKDIKIVFDIGKNIWNIQREIKFFIAKEDYLRVIELKKKLKKLQESRDSYDALYETSRYENMIVLDRPSSADYLKVFLIIIFNKYNSYINNQKKRLQVLEDDEQRQAYERRKLREMEEAERIRLLNELMRMQQMQNQPEQVQEQQQPELIQQQQPDLIQQQQPEEKLLTWWEKDKETQIIKKKQPKIKKKEEQKIEVNFNNPIAFNQGDIDLELYLKPLLVQTKEKLPEISSEILRRLFHLGYLQIFGTQCWTALYSENWRHREASAQAVLNFIEMPLPEKYLNGNSKLLFLACMEMAKTASEDKILQIYFIGLKILSTALAPPVCGSDVSPKIINQALKEFTPMLINKVAELNFRSRDISLHTLLSIYKHPVAEIGQLISACLEICIENPNFQSLYIPPYKQPYRLMMARLEIVLNIIQESGYDERQWNWLDVFQFLLAPCLFHPSNEVRLLSIELIIALYQLLGQEVRDAVDLIENLKPNLVELIYHRLDEAKDVADKNQKLRENQQNQLTLVRETEDPIMEQTPPGSVSWNQTQRQKSRQEIEKKEIEIEKDKEEIEKEKEKEEIEEKLKKSKTQIKKNQLKQIKGVVVQIDAIFNVQESKYPHIVFVSLFPGGSFHQNKKIDNFTKYISDFDWSSSINSPHFKPNHFTFRENLEPKSFFLVEVKSINLSKQNNPTFDNVGWTCIPIYEGQQNNIQAGIFQVPLYKGDSVASIIEEMKFRKPSDIFNEKLNQKKITYLTFTSVLIRIDELENLTHFQQIYDINKIDQRYIPPKDYQKWIIDEKSLEKMQKSKDLMNKIIPKSTNVNEYNKTIIEVIQKLF